MLEALPFQLNIEKMEQTTTATQVATNQTENLQAAEVKKPKVKKAKVVGENLTFPIMNSKRENIGYIHPNDAKNPLQLIGNIVKEYAIKILFFADFPRNHVVVTVPAAGSYGNKERALIAHKNYLEAITVKMERDEQITDKKTLDVLQVYRSKGWKFTTFTKVGIITVAKERVKEVSSQVNLVKQITLACPELKKLVFDNNTRSEIAKEIKDNGLEAGIKLAKEKSYKALPAIQK